jgi:hypothetical protein
MRNTLTRRDLHAAVSKRRGCIGAAASSGFTANGPRANAIAGKAGVPSVVAQALDLLLCAL